MSDLARQYPPGQELAVGGGLVAGKVYPAGKEPAVTAKGDDKSRDYKDDRTK